MRIEKTTQWGGLFLFVLIGIDQILYFFRLLLNLVDVIYILLILINKSIVFFNLTCITVATSKNTYTYRSNYNQTNNFLHIHYLFLITFFQYELARLSCQHIPKNCEEHQHDQNQYTDNMCLLLYTEPYYFALYLSSSRLLVYMAYLHSNLLRMMSIQAKITVRLAHMNLRQYQWSLP